MKCGRSGFVTCLCCPGCLSVKIERWTILRCVFLIFMISRPSLCSNFDNSTIAFVEKCQLECRMHKDFSSCGKYRIVRWFDDIVKEKEFSYGPLRVIRIPSMPNQSVLPKLPRSRVFRTGMIDTLSFLRDSVDDLLTKRALVYTIDNSISGRTFDTGLTIMDEDDLTELQKTKLPSADWRIFKKKKSLILPILILLNLVKLKLLLLPILLGVHFIKKMLVLGSLTLPSILSHLKVCKVQQQQPQIYPHHTWATAAEAPADYPTGYGQEDTSWVHRNDVQGNFVYPAYHAYRNPYG